MWFYIFIRYKKLYTCIENSVSPLTEVRKDFSITFLCVAEIVI